MPHSVIIIGVTVKEVWAPVIQTPYVCESLHSSQLFVFEASQIVERFWYDKPVYEWREVNVMDRYIGVDRLPTQRPW